MISRSRLPIRIATTLVTALVAASAVAIVDTTSTTTPLGADSAYGFVGAIGGGSAVAVGPHAFLTAGHVASGYTSGIVVMNGVNYTITGSVDAPDYTYTNSTGTHTTHVDLTMVFVQQALPGFYTVPAALPSAGGALTLVGVGGTGLLRTDGTGYDVPSLSDPNLTNAQKVLAATGTRRAGSGAFDGSFVSQVTPGLTGAAGYAGGPILYSALGGPGDAALVQGDSGGGFFSGNSLVGISVATFTTSQGIGAYDFPVGGNFAVSGAIDLTNSQIRSFVAQAVPEPTSVAALGIGALALLRRKRK